MPRRKKLHTGGRPAIEQGEPSLVVPVRMTAAQKAKLSRIGGAARLRKWLDSVKEDKPAQ